MSRIHRTLPSILLALAIVVAPSTASVLVEPRSAAAETRAAHAETRVAAAETRAAHPAPENAAANEGQDPDNEQFARLLEAQSRYQGIAQNGGWPALPDGDAMKPGERYDCARVEALAKRLEAEGYRKQAGAPPAEPDSGAVTKSPAPASNREPGRGKTTHASKAGAGCEYAADLSAAVEQFQQDRYLKADGIVGGQTQHQLARPVADVLAKIDYAIKRWRANAANMNGTYVVVNIPAFQLAVYDGPKEVLTMPVIVGMTDWETPELSDKIDSIVVNPSWNIPKTIAAKEVLPKSRKDRGYLAREGIVSHGGNLTQKPGPKNPLGRLKFMMPNREDVYLHDTPNKQKFESAARAFSHGCVRVQKPLDLASFLLKDDPKWTREALQSAIDSKETQTIKLASPVAVHLLYIPAVVSSEGRLKVAPDIYDRIGNTSDERAMAPAPTEEGEFLGAYP